MQYKEMLLRGLIKKEQGVAKNRTIIIYFSKRRSSEISSDPLQETKHRYLHFKSVLKQSKSTMEKTRNLFRKGTMLRRSTGIWKRNDCVAYTLQPAPSYSGNSGRERDGRDSGETVMSNSDRIDTCV